MNGKITTSYTDQVVVSDTKFQNVFGKLQKIAKTRIETTNLKSL